jgi:hypothetical protein
LLLVPLVVGGVVTVDVVGALPCLLLLVLVLMLLLLLLVVVVVVAVLLLPARSVPAIVMFSSIGEGVTSTASV